MSSRDDREPDSLPPELRFLAGGGRATDLILARDWSQHPLGPPQGWPEGFKATLSMVLNSSESMILCWDPDDLWFFFNEAYFPLLGPRLDWAMGALFTEVWADAWAQAKPIIDDAFAGRSQRFTDLPWKLATDRGAADTWWSFSYSRILDAAGDVVGLFIFTNETTERVLSDRALAESQEELRALNASLETEVAERTAELDRLWDASPDLLLVIDFDGVFRRVNPAWTALLGYTPDELVGHHVNEFLVSEDHDAAIHAYEAAAGGTSVRIENRYRHKDGSLRTIAWVAAPAGRMIYATGRDVTAERQAAAALRLAEEQLRQAQKVEAVGQLTGGVAHDFNNLLTVIRGSMDLLRRPNVSEARRERYMDAVADAADRAAKLTSQLLAFSRRQTLTPETMEVRGSIKALRDMIGTLAGARIEVVLEAEDCPCFIHVDRTQFDTAIINMAANARDAMGGEGRLQIRVRFVPELPPLRHHDAVAGEFVAISIIDDGEGIPPEDIDRIFEPFYTTKQVGHGTGLGLSQVFGFAKQSGGDVVAESVLGQGATFTLFLPVSEAAAPPVEAAPLEVRRSTTKRQACILVVEDNGEVGAFARSALEALGHDTVLALDGAEALAELESAPERFDLVFSDVMMPGMSGIELAREVEQRIPGLPVVLTSGYSSVLAAEGSFGFELIQKPYSIDDLAEVLGRVLDMTATRRTEER